MSEIIHVAGSQCVICFMAGCKRLPQKLLHFCQAPPPAIVILTYMFLRPRQEILVCLMEEQLTLTGDLL